VNEGKGKEPSRVIVTALGERNTCLDDPASLAALKANVESTHWPLDVPNVGNGLEVTASASRPARLKIASPSPTPQIAVSNVSGRRTVPSIYCQSVAITTPAAESIARTNFRANTDSRCCTPTAGNFSAHGRPGL
jgi:hypothetical protein